MESQNAQEVNSTFVENSHINGLTIQSTIANDLEESVAEITDTEDCISSDEKEKSSEVLSLLQLFKEVYKQRISAIDNNENLDLGIKNEEKLSILQSYLLQLEEQNDVLVSTLIELEKEAHRRVQQMEKRLKSSAKTTMEAVVNVHECEKEMRRIVEERLCMESLFINMQQHLSSVKVENSFLRDQNFNLNHDVQALLHVIHHARSTGHWEMNCVTFCEVTPEQVFGPVQSISHVYSTESPQSDFHLTDVEGKAQNSCLSSQEVSNSSVSSPSMSHTLGSQMRDVDSNMQFLHEELLEKDKKIAHLESRLSEMRHQLTIKDAECDYHTWKLEALMQQNQNRMEASPPALPSASVSLQKCISLPDIGNIYSCANVMRKSYSCRTVGNPHKPCIRLAQQNSGHNTKPNQGNRIERTDSRLCRLLSRKEENVFGLRRAQSEPHLFMFGDNVYVYRPCESIKKASNVALNEDYQLSLPPCQSIDLKFPTEDSTLKVCDWDVIHKKDSYAISDRSYRKIDDSSTSCSSSDLEGTGHHNISCSIDSPMHIHRNMCSSSVLSTCVNCYHQKFVHHHTVNANIKSGLNFKNYADSSVQTDERLDRETEKIAMQSIGLQANIDESSVKGQDLVNDNGLLEMDLSQIKKTILALKDTATKAEDKAEAKGILIEQLQGHLTSAVKEVELKDKALSNVEKKLEISRNDCAALKEQVSKLNGEVQDVLKSLKDAHSHSDDLLSEINTKEERIKELAEEQKILQNQKRALMTQLDTQGDELETAKRELLEMRLKTESLVLQVEQQSQIIKNLQEALVKSKRAFDDVYSKMPLHPNSSASVQNDTRFTSRSSIVDI